MNIHLEQLIKISEIDKEIDALEPIIAAKREKLDKSINAKLGQEQKIADMQDTIKEFGLNISKNEILLSDIQGKIDENNQKLAEIKSDRELNSLNIEKNILQEQASHIHEEIIRLEKLKIDMRDKIQIIEESFSELNEEIKNCEKDLEKEMQIIRKDQEKIAMKKADLVQNVDQKILAFYEKIRKWAHNTSVVPVYKHACGGCFIKLNDKTFNSIKKAIDITTCPHCGRILHFDASQSGEEQVEQEVKPTRKRKAKAS